MPAVKSVGIACCRATPEALGTDLYPDSDSDLLVREFHEIGIDGRKVAWDDPDVDWSGFETVIICSTWDGIDRPREYLEWVHQVSGLTVLQNPASIIEWNIDKAYLKDVEQHGVPTIPTAWVAPGETWEIPTAEFVVKPSIASGARNTARYSPAAAAAALRHVSMLGESGQTSLIQEYLPLVEHQGETSIVFIADQVSHAVRQGSFLNVDEGIHDNPWERMTYLGSCEAAANQLAVAERAFNVAQQRAGRSLAYARVDLIPGRDSEPVVLEMELIDPFLSLGASPSASAALASVIARNI